VKGARNAAFAPQLANVAQIDESDVIATMLRDCFFDRQGLDLAFGGVDQSAKSRGNFLRHRPNSHYRCCTARSGEIMRSMTAKAVPKICGATRA
jgi:hypothetical protein